MRALLVAVALTLGASAQPAPVDAWLSLGVGPVLAQQAGPENDFYLAVAAHLVEGPWVARLSYAEVDRVRLDFSGAFAGARAGAEPPDIGGRPFAPDRFQTLAVGLGRASLRDRTALAATVGPSVTWGEDGARGYDGYVRAGVSLTGQGAVRVVGPLWAGVEAAGTMASGASHAGGGLVLRVDLARRER
ncbi:hypothetical protein [Rubrivirga sp. IMCC45206]|uniref:hypothetical protein n=1 Tax=Rubrivirga sp. IMCC45206 TaxID=3391614 RepID=UPI00398FCB91